MDYAKCTKWLGVDEKLASLSFLFLLAKYFERTIWKSFNFKFYKAYILSLYLTNLVLLHSGLFQKNSHFLFFNFINTFYKLFSDEYQDKASSLGFVLLKGNILEKSRDALKKIGR